MTQKNIMGKLSSEFFKANSMVVRDRNPLELIPIKEEVYFRM